ncbi:hypothetical protein BDN72DRAFT_735061, partial [Pluteus cervinus]
LSVNQKVLESLANRLAAGQMVKAESDAEKQCYQLIRDLDHIGGHVEGSTTSKKYMRNEIWSLIAAKGAPTWYITLSPVDIKNRICIYYADTKENFDIDVPLPEYGDRMRLISQNPVAAARFFNFFIKLFIKHILGVESNHEGIYGKTSAYYGTVEQ